MAFHTKPYIHSYFTRQISFFDKLFSTSLPRSIQGWTNKLPRHAADKQFAFKRVHLRFYFGLQGIF